MKGLSSDLPYPDLTGIESDYDSACIISPAYAGLHGEITAILQYRYHGFMFKKAGLYEFEEIMSEISVTEMRHFEILGELLTKLGVSPVYGRYPPFMGMWYNTGEVSYSESPQKMLLDDIASEMLAVKDYDEMLSNLENEKVGAVIQRIKIDEEEHIKILKNLYMKISSQ